MPTEHSREATINGLRELADFFEANPEAVFPDLILTIYAFGEADSRVLADKYARMFKTFTREQTETFFNLTKAFSGRVKLKACFNRKDVCVRLVVGKKKVMVERFISPTAVMVKEPTHMVEEEIDIVEWECPKSLLSPAEQHATDLEKAFIIESPCRDDDDIPF